MPATELVRSWTDVDFRSRLTPDELAQLPDHPAGSIEAELDQLAAMSDPAGLEECPMTSFSRNPCCG